MKNEMGPHRALVPLLDTQQATPLRQRVHLPQDECMGKAEMAGEGAAVTSNTRMGCSKQTRLDRCQPSDMLLQLSRERQETIDVGRDFAHAASRLRNVTMIDLEVGVSLSSPALPSGTSTFSSG